MSAFSSPQARKLPILVYDGDCSFCRQCVLFGQRVTGDRVRYESYQTAAWRYPEVPVHEFKESIQYFENGKRRQGADAVFHALAWGGKYGRVLVFLYKKVFFFAAVSEFFYRIVARNRAVFSLITQRILGKEGNSRLK